MPLRSHHVLLFRLVASDCLSCSAALGHSVLSSLALSFLMLLSPCLRFLLSCYSACTLSALLCHEATSIYRMLRSSVAAVTPGHPKSVAAVAQGHPNQILCPCVCKGQRREEEKDLDSLNCVEQNNVKKKPINKKKKLSLKKYIRRSKIK